MDSTEYYNTLPKVLPGLPPGVSFWTVVALVITTGLCILLRFLQPRHHSQEPAVIPQAIPYIGHIVGIVKHGLGYYQVI